MKPEEIYEFGDIGYDSKRVDERANHRRTVKTLFKPVGGRR
jgi:hypothetical protein